MEGDWRVFEARVEEKGGLLLLRLPEEVSQTLPSRGMVVGEGDINRRPFTLPLEPDGRGGHWLELNGEHAGNFQAGSLVSLCLRPAADWPEPPLPEDLGKALEREGLMDAWTACTVRARWEWIRWVRAAGSPLPGRSAYGQPVTSSERASGVPAASTLPAVPCPGSASPGCLIRPSQADLTFWGPGNAGCRISLWPMLPVR